MQQQTTTYTPRVDNATSGSALPEFVQGRSDLNVSPAASRLATLPRSTLINRNIMVGGRRTSVRLEPEMWTALLDIARRENQTIHAIATQVAETKKPETSLTAAIRVFCLAYYRTALGGG